MRVDHPLLRLPVAALDALRERDLLGRSQQLVLSELAHEQRHRVGHAGEVGLEAESRVRVGTVSTSSASASGSSASILGSRDLDPARLELAREEARARPRRDRARAAFVSSTSRLDDAVALGLVDEARQFVRVKDVSISFSSP